jgi:uncharacterized protein involved in exopolysaccharide biosynthesis
MPGQEREGGAPRQPVAAGRDYAFRVYAVDGADEVRLQDLWRVVWTGRWTIMLAALATGFLAFAASFLITPVYRSTVLAAPITESVSPGGLAALASQFTGVAALAGLNLGGDNRTAEAVATLRSRAFTESFIRERNLMPILFPDAWDEQAKAWKPGQEPTGWEAFKLFDGIRSVDEDVTTGLITVAVKWRDPGLAAEWANGLVTDVNARLRAAAIQESRQNLEYLQAEVGKSSQVQLHATIFSLIESQMQNAMLANVKVEYAFRVIDPATAAEKRHWPNRLLLAVLGLFAGGMIGILVAVGRNPSRGRA